VSRRFPILLNTRVLILLFQVPVGLSISVTFVSAVTIVGYPTESYGYGTIILWYSASGVIPTIMACVYYIPLVHRLHLWSIYEVTILAVLFTSVLKWIFQASVCAFCYYKQNFSSIVCKNDTANLLYFELFCLEQYLERRFHKRIRALESVITIFTQVNFAMYYNLLVVDTNLFEVYFCSFYWHLTLPALCDTADDYQGQYTFLWKTYF